MKRRFAQWLSLLLTLALLLGCAPLALAEETADCLPKDQVLVNGEVVFNDAAVQQVIESNWLINWYGAKKYLAQLTQLDLTTAEAPVRDLSVLQLCGKLEWLKVDCAELNSFEPLTKCAKLKTLILENVGALSLEPLTRMKKLSALTFGGAVADLSFVENMKSLTELELQKAGTVDLTAVAAAPKLSAFLLNNTDASCDITPLTQAKKLSELYLQGVDAAQTQAVLEAHPKTMKALHLWDVAMTDGLNAVIGACAKLSTLRFTRASGLDFSKVCEASALTELTLTELSEPLDLAPLSTLKKLNALTIGTAEQVSFAGVEALPKLKTLAMQDSAVDGMAFLANAPALETLSLSNVGGLDFAGVEKLPKLKELTVSGCTLGDMSVLNGATALQTLTLEKVKGADFSGVEALPKLKTLDVRYIDSQDLSVVAKAPKLETLVLAGCRPSSYDWLTEPACAKSLKALLLGGMDVSDLTFVQGLSKLQELVLLDLPVSELSPLASASKLKYVNIFGCPVTSYEPLKSCKKLSQLVLSDTLSQSVMNDLKAALGRCWVQTQSAADLIDPLYEAAVFFEDENPQKREDRESATAEADAAASAALDAAAQAEQEAAAAAELEAAMKDTHTLTADELDYYDNGEGICVYRFGGNTLSARIPDTIDGRPVVEVSFSQQWAQDFDGVAVLTLPASVRTINVEDGLSNLSTIILEEGNEAYTVVDGVLYTKDMSTLVCYPCKRVGGVYEVPEGVKTVEFNAFSGEFWDVWYNGAGLALTLPSTLTKYKTTPNEEYGNAKSRVTSFTVAEDNAAYATLEGSLTDKAGTTLLQLGLDALRAGKDDYSPVGKVPDGIETLAKGSLDSAWYCSQIELPASLKTIESGALTCSGSFVVDAANPCFVSTENAFTDTDGKTLYFAGSVYDQQTGISTATIPDGVETVLADSLSYFDVIEIPASVTSMALANLREKCSDAYVVDEANTVYSSKDGLLFSKDGTVLLSAPTIFQFKGKAYTVPDGVTEIGDGAFEKTSACRSDSEDMLVDTLTLPESVVKLGRGALCGYNLTKIVLPANISVIGPDALASYQSALTVVAPKDSVTATVLDKYCSAANASGSCYFTVEYK